MFLKGSKVFFVATIVVVGIAIGQSVLHRWIHETAAHQSELVLIDPPSTNDPSSIDRMTSRLLWRKGTRKVKTGSVADIVENAATDGTATTADGHGIGLEVNRPLHSSQRAEIDYVIIAGAWRLPDRRCGLSRAFKQRLLAGLNVAEASRAKTIVVSGGRNDTYCGTTYIRHVIHQRWLRYNKDLGRPTIWKKPGTKGGGDATMPPPSFEVGRFRPVYAPDSFLYENNSTTTYTNAVFSKEALKMDVERHSERASPKIAVVTSAGHLKRTKFFFRQVFGKEAEASLCFVASHPDEYEFVWPQRNIYWAEDPQLSAEPGELGSRHPSVNDENIRVPFTIFRNNFPCSDTMPDSVSPNFTEGSVMTARIRPQEEWWFTELEYEEKYIRGKTPHQEREHSKRKRCFVNPTKFPWNVLGAVVSRWAHTVWWTLAKWQTHLRATTISMERVSDIREVGGFVVAVHRGHLSVDQVWSDLWRFVSSSCHLGQG